MPIDWNKAHASIGWSEAVVGVPPKDLRTPTVREQMVVRRGPHDDGSRWAAGLRYDAEAHDAVLRAVLARLEGEGLLRPDDPCTQSLSERGAGDTGEFDSAWSFVREAATCALSGWLGGFFGVPTFDETRGELEARGDVSALACEQDLVDVGVAHAIRCLGRAPWTAIRTMVVEYGGGEP